MKTTFLKHLLFVSAVVLGSAAEVRGQMSMLTPHNMGMGGGGTAYIGDFHAMYVNPANMLLNPRKTTVSVGILPNFGFQIGGPFIGIGDYNDFFTGGATMDAANTDRFLTQVFGTDESALISANMNIDVVPFGVSARFGKLAIGLGMRTRLITEFGFSRGFTQVMLRGLDYESFSTPRGLDMTASVASISEASLGLAFEVLSFESVNPFLNGRIMLGVAPKYVVSNAYTRVNLDSDFQIHSTSASGNLVSVDSFAHRFNIQIETVGDAAENLRKYVAERRNPNSDTRFMDTFEIDPASFARPAATTIGFDLGLTYEANLENLGFMPSKDKFFRLAVSITDIGQLDYGKDGKGGLFTSSGRYVYKGIEVDEKRIDEEFDGDFNKYIDHVFKDSVGKQIYGAFVEDDFTPVLNLPTALNVGAYMSIGRFGVSADYSQGLYALGTSVAKPVIALGAEWRVMNRWFPLTFRGGTRFGGITPAAYSFGTGLSFRNIDFTISTMAYSGKSGDGMYFATALTGLVVRF